MLRRFSLAVLSFAVSGSVLAGGMGPVCLPGSVTVPCVESFWEFGAQALYLTTAYSTPNAFTLNEFFTAGPILLPNKGVLAFPAVSQPVVDPFVNVGNPWSWGYFLTGAYHFNTGNDVTVNWLHYQASVTGDWSTVREFVTPQIMAPLPPITTDFNFYGLNRFDQINFEFGQLANFDFGKKLRFYGGLQLARVQTDADTCFTFALPIEPGLRRLAPASKTIPGGFYNNSDFKGIGPVVGIDYAYYLSDKLSLTANGGGSILIGTNNYNAAVIDNSGAIVLIGESSSENYLVPTLQGTFGANLAIPTSQGIWNLQVGYLALNYFHVIQGQPYALEGVVTRSNYGLVGPYAGLSYLGQA